MMERISLDNYGEVKIIIRHRGNLANLDASWWIMLKRVNKFQWIELYGSDIGIPFCPYTGRPGDCDNEEHVKFSHDGLLFHTGIEERMVNEWISNGARYSESDGMLVIDATMHESVVCDEHKESGCVVCYSCQECEKEYSEYYREDEFDMD